MNILVVDFNALLYRSWYGLEKTDLKTRSGVPTFAVLGFVKAIISEASAFNADYVVVCDDGGSLFRKTWYSEYKANRTTEIADSFATQKQLLRGVLPQWGIPILKFPCFEADDAIGTIVKNSFKLTHRDQTLDTKDVNYRIFTIDYDLLQLVSSTIQAAIFKSLKKGNVVTELYLNTEDVKNGYGVYPNQICDYKALVGDTSDNIPGIKGVGDATGVKFCQLYSSLEEARADNFSKLAEKLREKILTNLDTVELSYSLASLYDVPAYTNIRFDQVEHCRPGILIDDLEFNPSKHKGLEFPSWKALTALDY